MKGIHKTGRGRSEQHKDHDTSLLFIKPRPCSLKVRTTYEQRVPTIQDAASAVIYDGREVPVDWLERGVLEMGDHSDAARNEEQNVYRKTIWGLASKKVLAGERIALVSPTLIST